MNPTVHNEGGFRFAFYMADLDEPPHVHVEGSGGHAKVWLQPVAFAWSRGLARAEETRVLEIIREHASSFLKEWERVRRARDQT